MSNDILRNHVTLQAIYSHRVFFKMADIVVSKPHSMNHSSFNPLGRQSVKKNAIIRPHAPIRMRPPNELGFIAYGIDLLYFRNCP